MAVVWTKTVDQTQYQVRSVGHTIRLFTDGVFHSQYNSARKNSNGIWDLLVMPAFLPSGAPIKRVLVLGVGGGAVIRMLLDHFNVDEIIGIELNPMHLYIARRFFGLNRNKIKLCQADALQWVANYQGPKFDLIIEDLFTENNSQPVRAVRFSKGWFNQLESLLNEQGLLIANFISKNEFRKSEVIQAKKSYKSKYSIHFLTDLRYDNYIAAFHYCKCNDSSVINHAPRLLKQWLPYLPKSFAINAKNIRVGTLCR